MRRRWIITLALLTGAAVACLTTASRPPQIVYEGKPLDQWLDAGYEDASRVLYEVGPDAADCIFAKLEREHPKYGRWGRYRSAWNRMPLFCRKWLPRPRTSGFDEWRACHCLLAIGPQVIPVLRESLKDRRFLVRTVSAQTLGLFGQRGVDIRSARPALEAALHDRDAGVRQQAAAALGHIHVRQNPRPGRKLHQNPNPESRNPKEGRIPKTEE